VVGPVNPIPRLHRRSSTRPKMSNGIRRIFMSTAPDAFGPDVDARCLLGPVLRVPTQCSIAVPATGTIASWCRRKLACCALGCMLDRRADPVVTVADRSSSCRRVSAEDCNRLRRSPQAVLLSRKGSGGTPLSSSMRGDTPASSAPGGDGRYRVRLQGAAPVRARALERESRRRRPGGRANDGERGAFLRLTIWRQ
jgi:hypothetical protein